LYENTLLFADQHIPYGNSVSNTRPGQALFPSDASASTDYHYNAARALFLGAQAGVMAFGRAMDWPMRIKWVEELRDAANILRITAGMIHGIKKTINSESHYPVRGSETLGELRETPTWAILN